MASLDERADAGCWTVSGENGKRNPSITHTVIYSILVHISTTIIAVNVIPLFTVVLVWFRHFHRRNSQYDTSMVWQFTHVLLSYFILNTEYSFSILQGWTCVPNFVQYWQCRAVIAQLSYDVRNRTKTNQLIIHRKFKNSKIRKFPFMNMLDHIAIRSFNSSFYRYRVRSNHRVSLVCESRWRHTDSVQ